MTTQGSCQKFTDVLKKKKKKLTTFEEMYMHMKKMCKPQT